MIKPIKLETKITRVKRELIKDRLGPNRPWRRRLSRKRIRPAFAGRFLSSLGACPLGFFIFISDTIEGFYTVKTFISLAEFFAQAFDMGINRSVIDINLVVISGVH